MPMNARLLRPTPSGLSSPLAISGCVGWYDSADLTAMAQNADGTGAVAAGDQVGWWKDKSPTAAHVTQGIATRRPTFTAAGFNGRDALVFDGSDDGLSRTSYSAQTGLAGLTRIWACAQNVAATFCIGRVNATGGGFDLFAVGNAARVYWGTSTISDFVSAAKTAPWAPFVFTSVYQGGASPTYDLYFGSVKQSTTVNGTIPASIITASGTLWIGNNNNTNFFWNGPVAEGIVYNRALSASEVAAVAKYLQKKWKLS